VSSGICRPPANPLTPSVFTAALAYQARGLSVIRAYPRSKKPAVRWGHWYEIPQEKEDVVRMFSTFPESNVGILCGAVSANLVVIDCENGSTFRRTRRLIEAEGVDTWIVETWRGGHIYLRTREPLSSTKTHDRLIDFRANGNYVLAPPSVHPSGETYCFSNKPAQIALVETAQLNFLGLSLRAAPVHPLIPSPTLRLLRGRDYSYPSRSEQEQAIVQGLVNAGLSFDTTYGVFLSFPAAGKFQESHNHNASQAKRRLLFEYEKA